MEKEIEVIKKKTTSTEYYFQGGFFLSKAG
jgi:hypothetical protein